MSTILELLNACAGFSKKSMLIAAIIILGLSSAAYEQANKTPDKWESFRFLLGDWIGEGSGQPGQGEGGSDFALELNDNVLVRKSYNHIPESKDHPAVNHEDMMVIYQSPQMPARAIYWDNEGHSIAYVVEATPDQSTLTFISETMPQAPRFKLIYEKIASDTLKVSFEIAPPDKPDNFSSYTSGVIHRK